MSTCSNSKMQTADPARTPAFNSNMIFNPQAVSWSVQCPHNKHSLNISLLKVKILKAEPHMFILMLKPLRRQRIFPETWIRLLRVGVGVNPIAGVAWTIKPCGVSAKGQHTNTNPLIEVDLISTCCELQHVWTHILITLYAQIFV